MTGTERGCGEGLMGGGCSRTSGLVVIDADAVQLQVAVPMVGARGVDAVLVADHLPKLCGGGRGGGAKSGWPHPPPGWEKPENVLCGFKEKEGQRGGGGT